MGYSPRGCKELDMTEQLTHTHTHTHTQEERIPQASGVAEGISQNLADIPPPGHA